MARLLVIGAGGVGRAVVRKAVRFREDFRSIALASRTLERCQQVVQGLDGAVSVAQVDASSEGNVERLLRESRPDIVINVALPYQVMPIMRACMAQGIHYIDTACPEVPGEVWHEPKDEQWYGLQTALHAGFAERNTTAVLGIGSDPGMVNVFCAYARETLFHTLRSIDILDVNAGNHKRHFATNFNPEINLREVQSPAYYWENGTWQRAEALSERWDFEFPVVGNHPVYLMDHDEVHSLRRFFPEARHIKFWMGFGDQYIRYFNVLRNVGLLSEKPINVDLESGERAQIVPLKMLKELLPDPASLAREYTGKTCIGSLVSGYIDEQPVLEQRFIYNICNHETTFRDVGCQAISFTAAVPALSAALLLCRGVWRKPGVFNVEQLPPAPFMELLPRLGMSWDVVDPRNLNRSAPRTAAAAARRALGSSRAEA